MGVEGNPLSHYNVAQSLCQGVGVDNSESYSYNFSMHILCDRFRRWLRDFAEKTHRSGVLIGSTREYRLWNERPADAEDSTALYLFRFFKPVGQGLVCFCGGNNSPTTYGDPLSNERLKIGDALLDEGHANARQSRGMIANEREDLGVRGCVSDDLIIAEGNPFADELEEIACQGRAHSSRPLPLFAARSSAMTRNELRASSAMDPANGRALHLRSAAKCVESSHNLSRSRASINETGEYCLRCRDME